MVKPFVFAGSYVAYPRLVSAGQGGPGFADWTEVVVSDLRPSRPSVLQMRYATSDETLREFHGGGTDYPTAEAFVTDLVLRPSGLVGWIECEGYTIGPCYTDADASEKRRTSVFAASPADPSRTKLDEGQGIDKRSLTWGSGAFHWRKDGKWLAGG